ncbi:calmodulin-regulated spectrin-associated protein 1-B-like [Polyodon spathula]|uniref:calmodulin-regulated spectrin-associated protein 1-B-like n=1 Tax=Polyodon spathula TaxID=7913 RepID=UPI001B7F22FB|nr:calmodulin-regulated spectrin-associated protein 1-B-like [Polyodon spathula]
MSAFAMETMSSVKISVDGLEADSGSTPSKLQPVPWEHAILFWVNKLIHKLQESTEREQTHRPPPGTDLQTQSSCPTRWYWKLVPVSSVSLSLSLSLSLSPLHYTHCASL